MRRKQAGARGLSTWLGLAGLLVAPAALAASDLCDCVSENQSVRSETPCLHITAYAGCSTSKVRNACKFPVTLEDWPLATCGSSRCSRVLQPGEDADFIFAGPRDRDAPLHKRDREERFDEETFTVTVEGRPRAVTVTAEVSCLTGEQTQSGCSSTAGAAALPAVLMLLGLRAGRRRAEAGTRT